MSTQPGWWDRGAGTGDMCQRTAGAKCQAACTGDGAWEKKREASLQINDTFDCWLGYTWLQRTSASGSSASRLKNRIIGMGWWVDNNKKALLTLTGDEIGELLCQGPSLPLQSPHACRGLSGLRLNLCLKNKPELLLYERHENNFLITLATTYHPSTPTHPWA